MREDGGTGTSARGLTATTVSDAIVSLALDVERVSEVPESHSSTVRVLRLRGGEAAVLKIPYTVAKMRRERTALESLAHLPFVARVLRSFETEDGRCGLLMSRLAGVPLSSHEHCSATLAESIGRALATIHRERMRPVPGVAPDGSWADTLRGRMSEYVPICAAAFPNAPWSHVLEAFHDSVDALPVSAQPGFIHLDFRIGNVLHVGDTLTGVIDFESSRNGERHIDFLKLALELWDPAPLLRDPLLRGYCEVLPVPAGLDALRPFHELVSAVACVAWSARRGKTATEFCGENMSRMLRALERLPSAQG